MLPLWAQGRQRGGYDPEGLDPESLDLIPSWHSIEYTQWQAENQSMQYPMRENLERRRGGENGF